MRRLQGEDHRAVAVAKCGDVAVHSRDFEASKVVLGRAQVHLADVRTLSETCESGFRIEGACSASSNHIQCPSISVASLGRRGTGSMSALSWASNHRI